MNRLPPVSTFMSPPETQPSYSFNSDHPTSSSPVNSAQSSFNATQQILPPLSDICGSIPDLSMTDPKISPTRVFPSPPISPWVGNNKKQDVSVGSPLAKDGLSQNGTRDPLLYPPSEAGTEHTHPLFPPESTHVSPEDQLITKHIGTHMTQFEGKASQPTFEEYKLALSCVPVVSREYNRNPGAWLKKERDYVEEQFQAIRRMNRMQSKPLRHLAPAPAGKAHPQSKVVKLPRQQRTPRTPKQTPKRTPRSNVFDSFDRPMISSPRSRNPVEKHDDTDYQAIPDFCPPLDSLNGNTKGLKAEWKGTDLYLGDDPDRGLLLPDEVRMASALRLTCAQYLTTKRRIFKAKVELLQLGNPNFKKTHAQKAGHIDVNKASRLWTAYEKVGWFRDEYFTKFLD